MSIIMRRTIGIAAFVMGIAGAAAAQTQSAPPAGNPPGQAASQRGGRAGQRNAVPTVPAQANLNQAQLQLVQETWNTMVLKRSQPFLALSDQQFPVFFMKLQQLQNVRDRHQRQRLRLINELARLTRPEAPPTDDATLLARTKDLDDLEVQSTTQEQQAVAAVDAVLTPFQRARFRVFEESMERLKVTMLAAAMRVAPGPPKPPDKPPHD